MCSQVSIILGGYKEKIENDLYAADKGMRSRFIPFEFSDYSDSELYRILKSKCDEDRCATTALSPSVSSIYIS